MKKHLLIFHSRYCMRVKKRFVATFVLSDTCSKSAFSLVEMLMALLVASLLMAALAPVMTKKFSENVNVTGSIGMQAGTLQKIQEIEFNSPECSEIKVDTDGSEYCEGEFEVPKRFNGYIKATVISGGGGGGVAPTAGFTEYTTAGSTNTFTVPAMTGNIEATLISGGAGGGAGGSAIINHVFATYNDGTLGSNNDIVTINADGTGTWTIPSIVRGKYLLGTACGGGGGGGASSGSWDVVTDSAGYGGGSGGYVLNKVLNFGTASSFTYYVGGGGGGGLGPYNTDTNASNTGAGKAYGGGGGGYGGVAATGGGNGAGSHSYADKVASAGAFTTAISYGGAGGQGGSHGTKEPWGDNMIYPTGGAGGYPGGGGGATVHFSGCANGGGGGGGGASQIVIGSTIHLNAAGGGGGAGYKRVTAIQGCPADIMAGGGGGGGAGGGAGGGVSYAGGKGGQPGGADGATYAVWAGGTIDTIFGGNYCNGNNGGAQWQARNTGAYGKSGAIRLTYLDYGSGGTGGGGGAVIPYQKVKVIPGETLNTIIADKAGGGTPASYQSNGSLKNETYGAWGNDTFLKRGSATLLYTDSGCKVHGGNHYGASSPPGISLPAGRDGRAGCVFDGIDWGTGCYNCTWNGASNTPGLGANNAAYGTASIGAAKSSGGRGGTVTVFGEQFCTPGAGGTSSSPNGGNATGYGCGGGGGYGLANGGSGSGGYARISWNKYWDTATNAYKLAEIGAGGGGASGNIFTYNVQVKAGEIVKIRIGKGGEGAYVTNNTLINAKKGGDTVFGDVKARGGSGGASVSVNGSTGELVNGEGGANPDSDICIFKTQDYSRKNKYCTKGLKGNAAIQTAGGKGANFVGFTYTKADKEGNETKIEIKGEGGKGGVPDTGDNSNGAAANGIASGGGGASIRDLGNSALSLSNVTNNPTKGGNGANGKIILEWWE